MNKTNITVTMPVIEYERLLGIESKLDEYIEILKRANVCGKAVMTGELMQKILDVYKLS